MQLKFLVVAALAGTALTSRAQHVRRDTAAVKLALGDINSAIQNVGSGILRVSASSCANSSNPSVESKDSAKLSGNKALRLHPLLRVSLSRCPHRTKVITLGNTSPPLHA
jgi:hypothetical protein